MDESGFRIFLNLSYFFSDDRRIVRIFINDTISSIKHLEDKIREEFNINDFYLCSPEYLPSTESTKILQLDEIVYAKPIHFLNAEVSVPCMSLKRKGKSIENDIPKKKSKKSKNKEKEKYDEPIDKNTIAKVKKNKNKEETKKELYPPLIENNLNDDDDNCENFQSKTDKKISKSDNPVDNNSYKIQSQDINSSDSNTINPSSSADELQNSKCIRSKHDMPATSGYNPQKLKEQTCKGNLISYTKKCSIPTITDEYLKHKKCNIIKIDVIKPATPKQKEVIENEQETSVDKTDKQSSNEVKENLYSSTPMHVNGNDGSEFTLDTTNNLSKIISSAAHLETPKNQTKDLFLSGIGNLLNNLRSTTPDATSVSVDASGEDWEAVESPSIKRKRKRVHRKKKPQSENSTQLCTNIAPHLPKDLKIAACPSMHVKFTENGEEESVILVNSSINTIDLANTSVVTINDSDLSSWNKTEIVDSDFTPNIGDIIAFKVLKMNDSYNPVVSKELIGTVKRVENEEIIFELSKNSLQELLQPNGKFTIESESESCDAERRFKWSDLLEPKLMRP